MVDNQVVYRNEEEDGSEHGPSRNTAVHGDQSEYTPQVFTRCLRSDKKSIIQLMMAWFIILGG